MFFQTSADTVGITKKGAMTRMRTDALAPHRLIEQQRQRDAEKNGDDENAADDEAWWQRQGQKELDETKRT